MKRFSSSGIGAITALGLAIFNPVLKADQYDRKTVISISQPLEVPGVVLPPGTYVMKLFNSSSNRHIVQFMNENQNRQMALTFAVSAERIRPTGKTVLTMYEGSRDAPPAVRTWFYPGDTVGQEFLYPHHQAARISERTNIAVPEIETAENSPAEAGPVKAAPTDAVPTDLDSETRTESPLIARAEPAAEPAPEPLPAPEPQQPAAAPQSQPEVAPRSQQTPPAAANQETPSTTPDSLPRTAGEGPLAALIGTLALMAAFGMRKLKRNRIG